MNSGIITKRLSNLYRLLYDKLKGPVQYLSHRKWIGRENPVVKTSLGRGVVLLFCQNTLRVHPTLTPELSWWYDLLVEPSSRRPGSVWKSINVKVECRTELEYFLGLRLGESLQWCFKYWVSLRLLLFTNKNKIQSYTEFYNCVLLMMFIWFS